MSSPRSRGSASSSDYELLVAALSQVAGAAMVLDGRLRVVAHTGLAEQLVGTPLPAGAPAAKLLCGAGPERPVADALAAGRPVSAAVHRLGPDGVESRVIRVRASPLKLGGHDGGWLLLLQEEPAVGERRDGEVDFHGIATRDPAMRALLRTIVKVARSEASVLVRGETGSGKELVARAIHSESPRAAGPFRAINCAALPPQLLESELFGHVRGAFTGAVRDAPGHIRLAEGGTLFLDEVAEVPLELQAKLLRVLQEHRVLPIGAREDVPVDVRFVAATHRSLRQEVEAGRFRADLMYRLRVIPLFLPPLRARPADVELLARRLVATQCSQLELARTLSEGAIAALESYDWPGNVRELQNAIEYALVVGEGTVLTEADLPPEILGESVAGAVSVNAPAPVPQERELPEEAKRLLLALERAGGSRERAAASLGMSRVTLWRKLRGYGLDPARRT